MWDDLRFAFRNLTRTPGFTAVAILSLALGIGANSAVFTLLDQVLLRSLAVRDPHQLVMLNLGGPFSGINRNTDTYGYPLYLDLRDHNQVFTGLAGYFPLNAGFSAGNQTDRIAGEIVTGNYFEVLGVQPALGRLIGPGDDRKPGAHPVVVLSYDFWKRRFGASPEILNQTVRVNGHPMTVIGVAAAGYRGLDLGSTPEFTVPMAMKREMTPGWYDLDNRNSRWLNVFGRLKPGVSIEQAQASINSTYAGFKEIEYASFLNPPASLKERFLKHQITLAPGARGRSRALRDMERPLTVLMVMVGVVLLIACTNVANLLLARAANRQKEIAVRLALGASRLQIVRQLLIESGVLSLAGGIAGLLVSAWTASLLIQLLSRTANEAAISATPDARILGFTLLLSFATGLLFGIVPALQSTRPDVAPTLKNQVNHTTSSAGHVRLRKGLVTLQVVLSVVLLVGAGLFGRSLYNLKSADLGFRADRLLAFSVDPSLGGYQLPQWAGFAETLQQRIAALPGVEAASIASNTPFSGSTWAVDVQVEGYPARDNEDTTCTWYFVSPRYFATMGVPLVAGREFHDSDRKTSPQTVIVNEAFVKYFFKDQNAIGRKVVFGDAQSNPWMEIVGIVRDGKHRSLRDTEIPRVIYLPLQQSNMAFGLNVLLRSGNDPQKLGSLIRQEVRQMDANLPVFGMRTLDEQVNTALRAERMIALLSIAFGFLATLLACVGLYGVMTYTVTQRTREIGIRMALGANQASVLALVMREVALMAAIGIALAIPIGIALSRLVESQLFGVRPGDPATLLAAAAGIALLSALAGFAPARRATRIAPTTALRYE